VHSRQQIAPAELEGILVSHPFVSEGTVCANWDKNQGTEVPMAYVTLSEKGKTYEGGLINALNIVREFVDGKVAPYKKLRGGIEVLNELPKTPSGKILKRLLPVRLEIARRSKI
jgi:4-coumarate--CoA ligase